MCAQFLEQNRRWVWAAVAALLTLPPAAAKACTAELIGDPPADLIGDASAFVDVVRDDEGDEDFLEMLLAQADVSAAIAAADDESASDDGDAALDPDELGEAADLEYLDEFDDEDFRGPPPRGPRFDRDARRDDWDAPPGARERRPPGPPPRSDFGRRGPPGHDREERFAPPRHHGDHFGPPPHAWGDRGRDDGRAGREDHIGPPPRREYGFGPPPPPPRYHASRHFGPPPRAWDDRGRDDGRAGREDHIGPPPRREYGFGPPPPPPRYHASRHFGPPPRTWDAGGWDDDRRGPPCGDDERRGPPRVREGRFLPPPPHHLAQYGPRPDWDDDRPGPPPRPRGRRPDGPQGGWDDDAPAVLRRELAKAGPMDLATAGMTTSGVVHRRATISTSTSDLRHEV